MVQKTVKSLMAQTDSMFLLIDCCIAIIFYVWKSGEQLCAKTTERQLLFIDLNYKKLSSLFINDTNCFKLLHTVSLNKFIYSENSTVALICEALFEFAEFLITNLENERNEKKNF